MKLLALVSGGKDSILSMMEAVKLGHTIGCIANVYPVTSSSQGESDAIDEIDSHCFQTVGHSNIAQLAECLQIPLRRRAIREGQSVNTELVYKVPLPQPASSGSGNSDDTATSAPPTLTDEVEELYTLIKDIITEFPDIQGVCSGAILSTYQRLRVENICERLGLQSYGYLWSMEGGAVLNLVAEQGVDAILIKVATVGLNPRKHLGQSLLSESLRELLLSLEEQYQVHPAGEGGEFESFVLDCPLFPTHCLAIASRKLIMVDDNPISPTGRMEFTVEIVPKSEESLETRHTFFGKIEQQQKRSGSSDHQLLPYPWEASFHACGAFKAPKLLAKAVAYDEGRTVLAEDGGEAVRASSSTEVAAYSEVTEASLASEAVIVSLGEASGAVEGAEATVTQINGLAASEHTEILLCIDPMIVKAKALSVADQLRDLLLITRKIAAAVDRTVRMLLVLAPDLSEFAPLNKSYAAIVGSWPLFPSRAFVGTGVAGRLYLRVMFARSNALVRDGTNVLDTLRIQSISHWAAATIGPYGQTVVERSCNTATGAKGLSSMVISGQIALTPSTLQLVQPAELFAAAGVSPATEEAAETAAEWRRFVAEFCVMLSNSLCPMMAMGPRESGDVWAANSSHAWRWLTTTSTAEGKSNRSSHTTELFIYLIDARHVQWAQWLWRAIVVGKSGASAEAAYAQPQYVVVKGLPRGGVVEMVTRCNFDTSYLFSGNDTSADDE